MHSIKSGIAAIYHVYNPVATSYSQTNNSNSDHKTGNKKSAVESAWFLEDHFRPLSQLTINPGVRVSSFALPQKTYFNIEPRFSAVIHFAKHYSLKTSYAVMNQYLHMLTYTKIGLPIDLWIPATEKVLPQRAQQWALGIGKEFPKHQFFVTVEAYYKKTSHIIAYKNGSQFLNLDNDVADDWQEKVTSGKGTAYGTEILLQKKYGKLSGWIGYTVSWSLQQFNELNNGKEFYAPYDRRHDGSVVVIYKPKNNFVFSTTWVYGTGRRITMPMGTYPAISINGNVQSHEPVILFTDKNSYLMPSYHRWDLSAQFIKKLKNNWERTWEVNLYNAYNCKNPYFYFMVIKEDGSSFERILKKLTLFPILPSVTYKFKF